MPHAGQSPAAAGATKPMKKAEVRFFHTLKLDHGETVPKGLYHKILKKWTRAGKYGILS